MLKFNRLSDLPARIFAGLSELTELRLGNNRFTELPDGVFSGMTTTLGTLSLDTLPLTISLKKAGDGIRATAPSGAPFTMELPVTVTNGELADGVTSLTIPIGATESGTVAVTRTDGATEAVTADLGTLPTRPSGHTGYVLTRAADLPVEVIAAAATPVVTLVLTPATIAESDDAGESGEQHVSVVTATVEPASGSAFTVAVEAAAVSPAVSGDFVLSTNRTLSFAAGATASTGTVKVTAVDNAVDGPDKTVTVSGTVTGASLEGPVDVPLMIRDDDAPGAPGTFEAVAGNGEVSLSWTAPAPLGNPVTKYQYRYKTDGGLPAEHGRTCRTAVVAEPTRRATR